jgi:GTPase SAR1 family protein
MNLVGRKTEIETVCEYARCGKNLAVSGAEGVGKTALLREVVSRIPDAIFCADTSTLKNACDSLLTVLGLPLQHDGNIQRKRAILQAVRGKRRRFVLDNVRWVAPQLLSFLDNLRESHTLVIAARSLASKNAGHLREILWDFERLELRNLEETDARTLIRGQIQAHKLKLPDAPQFESDVLRLSHGNPRVIVELCEQASKGRYSSLVVSAGAGPPHQPITNPMNPSLTKEHAKDRLKEYHRIKLSLANQSRLLREVLKQSGDAGRERECGELMVKLAEDRFTLAVVGQFKRGKSSLMNAIIGRELLPTGVLPITSAITVLKFGPTERLIVEREGIQWPETLPVSQLEDYVTERGNPGNNKKVKTATLEVPLPFLRRGLEFVDTPGIGSAITANTATTYAFLPQCDAVLFVTSVDTPFTSAELEFLQTIREHVHKIFFVVNKNDLLGERDRREVLEFIGKTVGEQMRANDVRIFPLSCKIALAAKADGDDVAYAQSGLGELQEALAYFLSEEKTATFLLAIVERAIRLAEAQSADARMEGVRHALFSLQSEILNLPPPPPLPSFASALAVSPPRAAKLTQAKTSTADPATALRTRGCPVCDYLYRTVSDFFAQWQYAIATDEKSQAEFAAELGFCPLHTWQLNNLTSPVGASVGYSKLVERVSRLLATAAESSDAEKAVRALVRDSKDCRVCRLLRETEQRHARKLAAFIAEKDGRKAYARSQGACLRHLALIIAASDERETVQFLLTHAARRFEEAAEDMQAFAMKTDALRRYLRNDDEQDALLRALTHFASGRSICVPWPKDVEL